MKVKLYMAISVDGFVAGQNHDTDWVCNSDWEVFSQMVKEAGCIVMGRKTYEVSGEDFPYDCDLNVVMTSDEKLHSKTTDKVIFTNKKASEVVEMVAEKGFETLLIIGGGKLNAAFLQQKLIDEIYLSVHPRVLGNGIKLFNGGEFDTDLETLGVKQLKENLVQLHYKVKKQTSSKQG